MIKHGGFYYKYVLYFVIDIDIKKRRLQGG
jgi:hypothetical protein